MPKAGGVCDRNIRCARPSGRWASSRARRPTGTVSVDRPREDGTSLYYYRARYYAPTWGRFISEDPISFIGGDTNRYPYAENDPINLTDPTGERAVGAALGPPTPGSSTGGFGGPGSGFNGNSPAGVQMCGDPDQLRRCLAACAKGGEAANNICRGIPDPRVARLCWGAVIAGRTACEVFCYGYSQYT